MTATPTTDHLEVAGGRLYYEVRGSGPVLLVIGQPMTSAAFGPLADLLAEDHTVVTYDPHGLGRSTTDDPTLDVTPEVQADGLAQLVEAVGGGPVDVFGSSGGAVAGLALAVRHPDLVRVLVAHEPPVTELLPDAGPVRAAVDGVEDAYRTAGSGAAWGKFVSLVVHAGPVPAAGVPDADWAQRPPAQDQEPPSDKARADDELFFLRMLKPFTRHQPDVGALRSGRPRVVIGLGEDSRGEVAQRSAAALAERLGVTPTLFPGDHAGFLGDAAGFARALREVLGGGGEVFSPVGQTADSSHPAG